jgi:hypothetical protein
MAILPVDVQALLVRMNDVSKPHQREHEGAILTQMTRGEEVAKTARDESNRVNEVKPHPEWNVGIEADKKGKGSPERRQSQEASTRKVQDPTSETGAGKTGSAFEDPYRGKIIDTKV